MTPLEEQLFSTLERIISSHPEIQKELNTDLDSIRRGFEKRYASVYNIASPRKFGDEIASIIATKFREFGKPSDMSYDKSFDNGIRYKIEFKSVRAISSDAPARPDGIAAKDMKTKTFMQTKPSCFDYIVCAVVYANQICVYLVPSSDIDDTGTDHSKPLKITKQHRYLGENGKIPSGHLSLASILRGDYCVGFLDDDDFEIRFLNKMKEYEGLECIVTSEQFVLSMVDN